MVRPQSGRRRDRLARRRRRRGRRCRCHELLPDRAERLRHEARDPGQRRYRPALPRAGRLLDARARERGGCGRGGLAAHRDLPERRLAPDLRHPARLGRPAASSALGAPAASGSGRSLRAREAGRARRSPRRRRARRARFAASRCDRSSASTPEFDELGRRAAQGYGNHFVRDAEYFNWRYLDSPRDYRCFAAYRDGSLSGVAVVGHTFKHGVSAGFLADLVVAPGGSNALRALLSRAVDEVRGGADALVLLPPAGVRRAVRSWRRGSRRRTSVSASSARRCATKLGSTNEAARGTSPSATSTSFEQGRLHHAAGRSGAPRARCDRSQDRRARGARRRGRRPRRRCRRGCSARELPRADLRGAQEGRPRCALRSRTGARAPRSARRRRDRAHVPDLRRAGSAARASASHPAPALVHALAREPAAASGGTGVDGRRLGRSPLVPARVGQGAGRSGTASISRSSPARRRTSTHDGLRLLALGRYSPAKGLDVVLRALAAVGDDVRLDVHGPALSAQEREHRAELERLVAELPLDGRVRLEDAVPRAEIPALLADARRARQQHARRGPGQGRLRGCGACVPVLASNPVFDSLLDPAQLFPREDPGGLADRIRALAALSPAERAALGRRLRERVEESHSVESWARGVLDAAGIA